MRRTAVWRTNLRAASAVRLAFGAFLGLSGCSYTDADIQAVREKVARGAVEFLDVSTVLESGPIEWMDNKSVRYKSESGYRTDLWADAQIPSVLRERISRFMTTQGAKSIFVHQRRVNIVMMASGIVPSGTAIGVIIAYDDSHGCDGLSTTLRPDISGLQCEVLAPHLYLYIHR